MSILISIAFYLIYGGMLWLALRLTMPANLLLKIALAIFIFGIWKFTFAWILALPGSPRNAEAFSAGDIVWLLAFYWLGKRKRNRIESLAE